MPICFDVTASTGSYGVEIAPGLLRTLLDGEGERVIVADAFLRDAAAAAGDEPIVLVADETAKSLDRMTDLIVALRDRGTTRGSTLIALGGGVVQDAAAFAASVYMRGIDWVYVPTTLLSMTDSCIGGKSSINVGKYKNIVGTFHPPVRVLVDPAMAATLSPDQVAAGLCEAAKICLCRGLDTLDAYLALHPGVAAGTEDLTRIIALSLQAKKWFVEVDEFDRGERLILNFGHTFGHALEAASGFGVSHGIAVGLGMLAAFSLGEAMGRSYAGVSQLAAFRAHIADLVATVDGLDAVLASVDVAVLMNAFASDKKHGRDRFAVILPAEDGRIERVLLPRDAAVHARIAQAAATMRHVASAQAGTAA